MLEVSNNSDEKRWHICYTKNNDFKCIFSMIRAKEGESYLSVLLLIFGDNFGRHQQ